MSGTEKSKNESTTPEDPLRSLPPRQQSIIIGLANTELRKATLSKHIVDVSTSYSTLISQNREPLVKMIETRLQEEPIQDILVAELTVENVKQLDEFAIGIVESDKEELSDIDSIEAYWSKLNVDWNEVLERKLAEKQAKQSHSGTLTKQGMAASPHAEGTRTPSYADQRENSPSVEARLGGGSQPQPTAQSDRETQGGIGKLQNQVEFTLETLEEEIEMGNDRAIQTAAVVRQVHSELNDRGQPVDQDTLDALHSNLQFTLDTLEQEAQLDNHEKVVRTTAVVNRLETEFDAILADNPF